MSKVDGVLDKYSAKVYKNRKKHVIELEQETQEVDANRRSIPGLINHRGCCYAGCKGVVLGPTKDALIITHGPIGCGFYSWGTRRNKAITDEGSNQNYLQYCFSTDLQESDIVFGGEKKLDAAIEEAVKIFNPKTIWICSTCPVGLIGDDLPAVAKRNSEKFGITVMSFPCEGYKGVSQSAGHHIANNIIIRDLIGTLDYTPTKHSVNILGEYNIGGDAWEIKRILTLCGYEVISTFTGDGSVDNYRRAHTADLNVIQCHRSINYIAEMMKIQYGTAWMKGDFIGLDNTIETLREMAKFFNDPTLTEQTEEVIASELSNISDDMNFYKEKLKGKTAAICVGGSRSHHYQLLLKDFGVKTVLAGYEFAHRDDYEGRKVIPDIVEDADLKNIDVLSVEKNAEKFKIYKTDEEIEELKKEISKLEDYAGMEVDMDKGAVIIDDFNHYETEEFLKILKPDIFFSGIKDKFVFQKQGILSRQLHSYDYAGPYAGFKGAVNFGKDVTMGLSTPVWNYTVAPWKIESVLEGKLGGEK